MPAQVAPGLPELLLWRSASVAGFFLLHYAAQYKKHLARLVGAWQAGKLHVALDSHDFRCVCITPTCACFAYSSDCLLACTCSPQDRRIAVLGITRTSKELPFVHKPVIFAVRCMQGP